MNGIIFISKKYDINLLGGLLRKIRTDRYEKDSKKYDFCKSQESLAKKLKYERRTICNWENGKSHPNIEQVLDLCNFLDCDIDYLLGALDYPIKSANEVANYTGIEYDNVISIRNNESLQNLLNYMISSEEFNTLVSGVNNEFINQYISTDILSAYKAPLMNHIKSAYAKFHAEVSPLEIFPEKVYDFLKKEIPFSNFSKSNKGTFITFIHDNLSSDRFNQIMLTNKITNTTDEHTIYNAFISDTVLCTYEIMEYLHTREIKMYQFALSFMNIVNGYVKNQCEEMRTKLQTAIKDIK